MVLHGHAPGLVAQIDEEIRNPTTWQQEVREVSDVPPEPSAPGQNTRLQRVAYTLERATLHFSPSWFSATMGTGITATILYQMPYQFHGLRAIAYIVYVLNLVLFTLFMIISIVRYTKWPSVLRMMLMHPTQSMFTGTIVMSLSTLINMCALSFAEKWGNGMIVFTWVLWWINAVAAIFITVSLVVLKFTRHDHTLDLISGVLLLPVVPCVVASSTGALIAEVLPPAHARLTIVASYVLLGSGLGLGILIFALFFTRLTLFKVPPDALIVTIFLPLGMLGQGGFSLLRLADALYNVTKASGKGLESLEKFTSEYNMAMSLAVRGISTPVALMIWGFALVWVLIAATSLLDLWMVSALEFNLGWWGLIFPIGTFTMCAVQLGTTLDSTAFHVIGMALSMLIVLLWLLVFLMTLYKVFMGDLFVPPVVAGTSETVPKHVTMQRRYKYKARRGRRSDEAHSSA
ncbi:Ssu1p [Malassezia vespertilionis]|uniref:Ssu1p n=1 Tax=Malassezia vespertilionis TaxID=2020962 RepID=A0A2N1JFB5_9BASI|nr:Ssu1p [Malassezia vespertilionis]